jgi:hypothetical protein
MLLEESLCIEQIYTNFSSVSPVFFPTSWQKNPIGAGVHAQEWKNPLSEQKLLRGKRAKIYIT